MSGFAPIKREFIVESRVKDYDQKFLSENVVIAHNRDKRDDRDNTNSTTTTSNRQSKKRFRGQNKNRRKLAIKCETSSSGGNDNNNSSGNDRPKQLCFKYMADGECDFGDNCMRSHDMASYMREQRLPDISDSCHNYRTFGRCAYGVMCRFGAEHMDSSSGQNLVDSAKLASATHTMKSSVRNALNTDLQKSLRRKTYDFSKVDDKLKGVNSVTNNASCEALPVKRETKKLDFRDKLYLAPLTTVGNLPFRRVCKQLGADITCGEMAMCYNILQGSPSEWALLRRHHTEDIFGVQLCGSNPQMMSRCAQLITETCDVDFIDINMGCPIDCVYKRGAGSALMEKKTKLEEIIGGMSSVMDIPLTLKMRTGVYEGKNIATKVISSVVKRWSASDDHSCSPIGLFTVHGRSREQRYTKLADWQYVSECAKHAQPIPLFGSGDVMSYEEYYEKLDNSSVSGVLLARGALIKPWLFTEIKERRTWDITATERLDILRSYVNYGLECWGSDAEGVTKTRRFLLEWLSFLHRYIPAGVLERLPQRINERPPSFAGRNELETLLASGSCGDWLKISEMFLGKVPEDFVFFPKHKANAY